MVSDMCRAAVKSNPKLTLKKLLPFICSVVTNLASGKRFVTFDVVELLSM